MLKGQAVMPVPRHSFRVFARQVATSQSSARFNVALGRRVEHQTSWHWQRLAAAGVCAGLCSTKVGNHSRPAAAARCAVSTSAVTIEKPDTHRSRQYEYILLKNGLQVVLASDPKCDKAAMALCVGVGRLHEPKDMPGLAHFCEHMLFLGTEKFPEEGEYKRFVKQHGGKCNASTGDDKTCYQFDVSPAFLEGAMDRFSQFFLTPLFTKSATEREINAVDSEHSMRISDDGRRSYASLLLDANPNHPLHWGSGNAKSLRDDPKARGVELHSEVIRFYKEHYTAEDMTLAVLGNQPLDQLRTMIEERFEGVGVAGRRALRGDQHGAGEPALLPKDFAGLCLRTPVQDVRLLKFSWQCPEWQVPLWRSKPGSYVSHMVGHEGRGSLLSSLKAEKWATALSAGVSEVGSFSLFQVTISLTEGGLGHVSEIGERLFAFLALLRGTPIQIRALQEVQTLRELDFRFSDDLQPYTLVSQLAKSLQEYPPEQVLSAPYRIPEMDTDRIQRFLGNLTVEGARVELVAKKLEGRCSSEDPWYGGKFLRTDLEEEWSRAWAAAEDATVAVQKASSFGLSLPPVNVFVPEDLTIKTARAPELPTELPASDGFICKAFYRPDDQFLQPKSIATFRFHRPRSLQDSASNLRSTVWCACIAEELNEYAYDADEAGLSFRLMSSALGVDLQVAGFHDKMPVLLEAIVRKMAEAKISEQSFAVVKDRFLRFYRNQAGKQKPTAFALRKYRELLDEFISTPEERLQDLEKLCLGDLEGEPRRLFANSPGNAVFLGNVDKEDCQRLSGILSSGLGQLRQGSGEESGPHRQACLPSGRTLWTLTNPNPEDRNNCVDVVFQIDATLANSALMHLLVRLLNNKVFLELRTKQQLGYIVDLSYGEGAGFLHLQCILQSEFRPEYVRGRIEECLKDLFRWAQDELTEMEFAKVREGLVSILSEAPKNLSEENSRYWNEVSRQRYDFQRRSRKRQAVQSTSLEDFKHFVAQLATAPQLCIEVSSQSEPRPDPQAATPAPVDRTWQDDEARIEFRRTAEWVLAQEKSEIPSRL